MKISLLDESKPDFSEAGHLIATSRKHAYQVVSAMQRQLPWTYM